MMMLRDYLAQEYVELVSTYYPEIGDFLNYCYVKVLECYIQRLNKSVYYLGIYYPQEKFSEIELHKGVLKEVAENIGLSEVVYLNADRIIRDSCSEIKRDNPRFWLELYWIATQHSEAERDS